MICKICGQPMVLGCRCVKCHSKNGEGKSAVSALGNEGVPSGGVSDYTSLYGNVAEEQDAPKNVFSIIGLILSVFLLADVLAPVILSLFPNFEMDGTLTGNVTKMITPFLVMVISFNVTGLVRSKKYNGSGKIMSVVGLILPVISIVILMFLLG